MRVVWCHCISTLALSSRRPLSALFNAALVSAFNKDLGFVTGTLPEIRA